MICDESVELSCTWPIAAGNNINNAVVMCHCKEPLCTNHRPPPDDIIDTNRTILLNNDSNSETCELNISLSTNLFINSLNIIISGCKILEIFVGAEEEYYCTYHGEYFDDSEGIIVYRYDIIIKPPRKRKFIIKLLNPDKDIWIYGIMLHVIENNDYVPFNENRINFDNVQNILSNSNLQLSDSAERCKKFLENYMTAKSEQNGPPNMQMLLSLVGGHNKKMLHLETKNENKNEENVSCKNGTDTNCDTTLLNDIKEYIDRKFMDLQISIDERLDRIERSQNEKLDRILKIIENKNDL